MKIGVFEVRADEARCLENLQQELGFEAVIRQEPLTLENAELVRGCQGISILGQSRMDEKLLEKLRELGVVCLTTRTVGYNHIDLEAARKLGVQVCNVSYGPESVADYTIMLLLLLLRNYKPALYRQNVNDYSLAGLMGRQVKNLTVGVVGTGRIGLKVMEELSGFGCRILASDPYPNEKARQYGTYVPLEQLWRESDCITLHAPLTTENYHMINRETLALMKDGVILLNCARGPLMDTEAVIQAVEDKKIGRLGMDVIEEEEGIYHMDRRDDILKNRPMAYLRQFPNVVMTQHLAFYTEEAVESMVEGGIRNLCGMIGGEKVPGLLC